MVESVEAWEASRAVGAWVLVVMVEVGLAAVALVVVVWGEVAVVEGALAEEDWAPAKLVGG